MRRALTLALLLSASAPAFAQEPSVSYTVSVESPTGVAAGEVKVRARVSGGVRPAEFASYHLRTAGGWSQSESVRLERTGESLFEDTVITEALPNDRYQIEVRAWGEVPPYNPNDPRTFARSTVDFSIDNAPETPADLQALTPASWLRVGWEVVETSERPDFLGYVVLVSKGWPCPPEPAAYGRAALVSEPIYEDPQQKAGDYCVRIAAARRSAVSGEILSPPTAPAKVSIAREAAARVTESGGLVIRQGRGAEDITFEVSDRPEPPPAPSLVDGNPVISDGAFAQDLPYGPQTVTQAPGWPASGQEEVSREAGVDPKRTASLIAGGLILATMAGLLRRFVAAVPRD